MIDPPSAKLLQTLQELQLGTARDLRRARPLVKRLSRDLPAFDSIWLDALVQLEAITPYQAKALEPARSEPIQIGGNLLLEKLSHGATACTYRARPLGKKQPICAVKQIDLAAEFIPEAEQRLQDTLKKLSHVQHRHIAIPTACYQHEQQLILESPYIAGHHLGEILVRRGRLPDFLVLEIGRQLINALAELEKQKVLHGDLRLSNVILTALGDAVLLTPGLRPAISPELTLTAQPSPERYDGIAPELIGTGNTQSTQSDIYALGCLLWQLLAGRPPFPTNDPLGKLSAHQNREVPDIRTWAPDTPDNLAKNILVMTHRNTASRASSFQQLQKLWGPPQRRKRNQIRQYLNHFERGILQSSQIKQKSAKLYWTSVVLLIALTGATSLAFFNQGAVNHLLEMSSQKFKGLQLPDPASNQNPSDSKVSNQTPLNKTADYTSKAILSDNKPSSPIAETPPTKQPTPEYLPLPQPDALGNIQLTSNGPFLAQNISHVGELTLVGVTGSHPIILIQEEALELTGVKVTLENIHFRRIPGSNPKTQPSSTTQSGSNTSLLVVHSEELEIDSCSFNERISRTRQASTQNQAQHGIQWNNTSTGVRESQQMTVRNCSFYTRRAAIQATRPASQIVMHNCLKLGPGPLFSVSGSSLPRLEFSQSTARGIHLLVELTKTENQEPPQELELNLENSLIKFSGQENALFNLTSHELNQDSLLQWFLTGSDTFVDGEWKFLKTDQTTQAASAEFTPDPEQTAGLIPLELNFIGPLSSQPNKSRLQEGILEAYPRVNEELPGINAELIPSLAPASEPPGKKTATDPTTQASLH